MGTATGKGSSVRPNKGDYEYDLEKALSSIVVIRAHVPEDAFTAEALGTARTGYGALIRADGLVLTVGYLVTEAETVWITLNDGRAVPGHVIAYDHETGFGLIQALARLDMPVLTLGDAASLRVGDPVVVGGAGGRSQSVAARVTARQEFAGYWEYLLDNAIFTCPAHPNWGGAALIGPDGTLLGVGSLLIQSISEDGEEEDQNMIMPVDVLKPVLDDLLTLGHPNHPPRPWLGLYATEIDEQVIIASKASRGPAAKADLNSGDIVLAVDGGEVSSLAGYLRRVWALGEAGIEVPLQIFRDGRVVKVTVQSGDRRQFLKGPVAH